MPVGVVTFAQSRQGQKERPVKRLIWLVMAMLSPLGGFATASAQATATVVERFYLSGVVVVDGGDAKAWLQEPTLTGERPVVVRVGDTIGRWTLTAISSSRVELEGPGGKVIVPLNGFGGPAAGAQPPAPAPRAAAVEAPPPRGGTLNIAVGDPRRRESIRELFEDTLRRPVGNVGSR
jgi:hypothetical protein